MEVNNDMWINWAMEHQINPYLITFIQWKPTRLYWIPPDENKEEKASTPRGIARASNMLGDMNVLSNTAYGIISCCVGEAFALDFQAYTKYCKELNWNQIFSNPSSVENLSQDQKFAVSAGLAERYQKNATKKTPDKELVKKLIPVVLHLPDDMAVNSLRMMREYDRPSFRRLIKSCDDKALDIISKRYQKYIV
jgi:hypothetical protein